MKLGRPKSDTLHDHILKFGRNRLSTKRLFNFKNRQRLLAHPVLQKCYQFTLVKVSFVNVFWVSDCHVHIYIVNSFTFFVAISFHSATILLLYVFSTVVICETAIYERLIAVVADEPLTFRFSSNWSTT
jgi:hypothetical protein